MNAALQKKQVTPDGIDNIIPLPQPSSSPDGGGKPLALCVVTTAGIDFITDGKYKCPILKGPYTIRPFANPSGKLVAQLDGRRPNTQGASEEAAAKEGAKAKKESPRFRKNYRNLKEADAKREELILEDENSEKRIHLVHTTLTKEEVKEAEETKVLMAQLPPRDWRDGKWTYKQLVKYVADEFEPCRHPKLLNEAVEEFNMSEKKSNLKFATTDGKATHLKRLIKTCSAGIMVHEVPLNTLKSLIHSGNKKKTWKKNRSNYNTFFEWAASEDRGYCPHNPVKLVKLDKKKDDYKVPKILTNEVILDLLTQAQVFKGGRLFLFCVVAIVVALRPAELARIQALRKMLGIDSFRFGDEPDEQLVKVIGKTRQLRDSIIPPEFVPLIKAYVDAGYPIIPRNFAHDWTLLRSMVGFLGRRDLLPSHLFSDKLEPWTKDVLRHIGITHFLNRSKDEGKTALWAGDSPKMIFFHYKGKAEAKETREFYAIASKLKLPTVQDLKTAGIPEGASDWELKRLKCPVDEPNTYFLDKADFEKARKAYIARHPEAEIPEVKGARRGKGMWTKRRMLNLPNERTEQIRLLWTNKGTELARQFKVARSTLALALEDLKFPLYLLPPKGYWQKRAAQETILLPQEVAAVFPDGLPPYSAPVGCQIKLQLPAIQKFLRLVWDMASAEIARNLGCSKSSIERHIRRKRLPRPSATYWLLKPEKRQLPERVKYLLTLDSKQLEAELAQIPPATN